MKQKAKILVAIAVLSLALIPVAKTQAAVNWADYFTQDEAKSIKKMVDKYIRNQIKNDADKWEGVIGKDSVDDSIAKKKVYTGTFPASEDSADLVSCPESDPDECYYFKKIAVSEIDMDEAPIVTVYTKSITDDMADNVWSSDEFELEDGYVWIHYASGEADVIENEQFNDEYKIIVTY